MTDVDHDGSADAYAVSRKKARLFTGGDEEHKGDDTMTATLNASAAFCRLPPPPTFEAFLLATGETLGFAASHHRPDLGAGGFADIFTACPMAFNPMAYASNESVSIRPFAVKSFSTHRGAGVNQETHYNQELSSLKQLLARSGPTSLISRHIVNLVAQGTACLVFEPVAQGTLFQDIVTAKRPAGRPSEDFACTVLNQLST